MSEEGIKANERPESAVAATTNPAGSAPKSKKKK